MSFEQPITNTSQENTEDMFSRVKSFENDLSYMSNKSATTLRVGDIAKQTGVTEQGVIGLAMVSKLSDGYALIFKMKNGKEFKIAKKMPKSLHRIIEILNNPELADYYAEKQKEQKEVTKLMKAIPGFKLDTPQIVLDYYINKQTGTLSNETARKIAAMVNQSGLTIQEFIDQYKE